MLTNAGKFMTINATWQGSAYDSFVFKSSALGAHLETQHRGLEDGILLGDSGCVFNLRRFKEHTYSFAFRKCIYKTKVRLIPEKASKIIMACAVLHNIAIILGEPEVEGDGFGLDGNVGQQFIGRETGFHTRESIVQQYF
ncbi:hypothetical protein MAR_019360 [Mya arenaria]|uniref:DDE Tnp4 domain-containing protein n=1 Tax=Mya arenaria TaxID=6604 RepID=A0ABY7EKB4_MYAAR|nr:hypothetical protein MAR_019360 [Mya arenaria]